jgi:hypothetical protein
LFGRKLNNAGVATEQHDAVQGHCCHYAERRPYGWLCHRRRWRPSADVLENTAKGIETMLRLGEEVARVS